MCGASRLETCGAGGVSVFTGIEGDGAEGCTRRGALVLDRQGQGGGRGQGAQDGDGQGDCQRDEGEAEDDVREGAHGA